MSAKASGSAEQTLDVGSSCEPADEGWAVELVPRACHNEASARWRQNVRVVRSGVREAGSCRHCGAMFLTWVYERDYCSSWCQSEHFAVSR